MKKKEKKREDDDSLVAGARVREICVAHRFVDKVSWGWFLYDQVYTVWQVLLLTVVKKTLHKRDTVSGSFQRFTRRQNIGHASIACDNI